MAVFFSEVRAKSEKVFGPLDKLREVYYYFERACVLQGILNPTESRVLVWNYQRGSLPTSGTGRPLKHIRSFLIEDTLMFGGKILLRSQSHEETVSPWLLPPGSPSDETPSPLARDEDDLEDEEDENEDDDEDDDLDDDDLDDDDLDDDDLDDEDFDDLDVEDFDDGDDFDDDEDDDDGDDDEDDEEEEEPDDEGV